MSHHVRRVFTQDGLRVDVCDCGEVHVHLDRTTWHLREPDVLKLLEGLSRAVEARRRRPAEVVA